MTSRSCADRGFDAIARMEPFLTTCSPCLRGRVLWHSSDGLDGNSTGRRIGQIADPEVALGGVRRR